LLTSLQSADAIVAQHARCNTTTIQLVDRLDHAELRKLRERLTGTTLVQVIHVCDESSIAEACEVAPLVDALLLDSGNPSLAVKELGGTGRVHDWQLSARIRESVSKPVYLAGGLNSANVGTALALVRPFGVDICSGVRENSALSPSRLAAFVAAVDAART
jgi:phosphoribosylanthranilate isomerase